MEWHSVHCGDSYDVAGLGRVEDLSVADVDADVVSGCVEEDEIAWPQLTSWYWLTDETLLLTRAGKGDPGFAVGPLH